MKNYSRFILNLIIINIIFSQDPCTLGDVYVSEAANVGDPEDYIEVYNGGPFECTLYGFQLDDSEDLQDFTFGNVILGSGDYWIGYENEDDSFSSGLSNDGDMVVLADAGGNMLTITLEESMETADGIELSQSFGSDGSGCYTLPTPGESNAECFEYCQNTGDTNGDSSIDVLDIVSTVNYILNLIDEINCADINDDGSIDVLDIVAIVNIILES